MIIDGNRKIGILGGSFNPAHDGHVHISYEAKKRLQLDAIWWLVSPGNPLKSNKQQLPIDKRLAQTQEIASPHPYIEATDLERLFKTRYSINTIKRLQTSYPKTQFTWLIGADNLYCFDQWRQWKEIMLGIPIAVFDRQPFAYPSTRSMAATYGKNHRIPSNHSAALPLANSPCWTYHFTSPHPQSSTAIRHGSSG